MTILITGGTGFLGSEIARILVSTNEKRIVLFDLSPSMERLTGLESNVDVIKGDLADAKVVDSAVRKSRAEEIYHLGGLLSSPSDLDQVAAFNSNVVGTFNILESARRHRVRQVLFSSTINTYGYDLPMDRVDDLTIQRPAMFYGATKLFCENIGRFYKSKYGIDFRGIRYPSIVGLGVKSQGISQYTSRAIEEAATGNSYTIFVEPGTRVPIIYIKEAAVAMLSLAAVPRDYIRTVVYLIAGTKPVPSAQDLVDAIKRRLPSAEIDFKPDEYAQTVHDQRSGLSFIDDGNARREWGWSSRYDLDRIVSEMFHESDKLAK